MIDITKTVFTNNFAVENLRNFEHKRVCKGQRGVLIRENSVPKKTQF